MSQEVTMSLDTAFDQAKGTALEFFNRAEEHLNNCKIKYNASDAIALANIMSKDMNAAVLFMKLQELRDSLNGLVQAIEGLNER